MLRSGEPTIGATCHEQGGGKLASSNRIVSSSNETEPVILIVDGDANFLSNLSSYLDSYGFSVKTAASFASMIECLSQSLVSIILLEQWVDRVDMVDKLADIQSLTTAPIIFLSKDKLESDRILALELGAADFLLKPMSGREIVARVRAHLRRAALFTMPANEPQSSWRLVSSERRLYKPDGRKIPLTGAEFNLLEHLVKAAGQPVHRESLMQKVLQRQYRPEDRSIDNLIYQVRQKIIAAGGGEVIISMRGQGYAFTGFEGQPSLAEPVHAAKSSPNTQSQNEC